MPLLITPRENKAAAPAASNNAGEPLAIQVLDSEHQDEVLAFLAARPLHTVFMAGFIRDNGLVSPLNRGTFYGCRNVRGRLEGVALIGHATLIEARREDALAAFARLAQKNAAAHMILGEQEKVELFWSYYSQAVQPMPRLVCREVLFEEVGTGQAHEPVPGLRQATLEDLPQVMAIQAQMAFEESFVNPLEADPAGFRLRCERRLNQGRIWVWVEDGRTIFKADIIADTPDVIYLEGIYVEPRERGKGYGLRCVSQLCRGLLTRTRSICLLVNEQNPKAISFYRRAGFEARSCYDTIFLHQKN
jgi:predicted GNAT family acetyltransferase